MRGFRGVRRYGPPAAFAAAAMGVLGPGPTMPPDAERTAPPLQWQRQLRVETLVTGLDTPWDLAWGPDNLIWVTERPGTISRVNPRTGAIARVGRLDVTERGESGLMGLAFHPDFPQTPYVYLAHSYSSLGRIRNRLVRLRFDGTALGDPVTLLEGIPGNSNHNGSRLTVGPDRMLYMTTGDAGRAARAQDRGSVAGKVLRFQLDGRRPAGNPFDSFVYSYGHRNPQGIVFHPQTGDLYIAEHGPETNDEVNRVVLGGNYGWPAVHGFCDGDRRGEESYCRANEVVEPVTVWTPTVGVSGADFYDSDLIPGWRGNLLVTSLQGGTLFRLVLSVDGGEVVQREALFRNQFGRLRDVLVGPDGGVYLATSNRDGRGNPAPSDDRILRILP